MCGFVSPIMRRPPTMVFNPTTPVPKNGSIQFALATSIPDRRIMSLIHGMSFVLMQCDFMGGMITAIVIAIFLVFRIVILDTLCKLPNCGNEVRLFRRCGHQFC